MCGSACGSGIVRGTHRMYSTVGCDGMRYAMCSSSGIVRGTQGMYNSVSSNGVRW